MNTPATCIRFPKQLIQELRGESHRESIRRGQSVSWSKLLQEIAERYLNRRSDNGPFGPTGAAVATA